jgi:GrpB-like predicted nucleotidyltransferase (UPF0157 family)
MRSEPLGLESGVVVVAPYDPRWTSLFAAAADELRAVAGSSIGEIHHVGSTAIPRLCAKPILDILVSVPDFVLALQLIPAIESLGYEFRPHEDIPDRHYFNRKVSGVSTHHLSLAEPESRHHRVTLAFRDALLASPGLRDEYAKLKLELATRHPRDRAAYIDGKTAFVERVLMS